MRIDGHDGRRNGGACVLGWVIVALLSISPAKADVVEDWTRIALHTVISSQESSSRAVHEMALVHVAMFETMNFIEGRYVPRFVIKPPQPLSISSAAAGAAAAHFVLVRLHPEREGALDAALERSIAAIPDAERASGVTTGKSLGASVYAVWASIPRTSTRGSGASSVAWYWTVAQFVEARRLGSLESARVYALVSMALNDLYGAGRDTPSARESKRPCASCAAGAAVEVILESELGPTGFPGMARTITSSAAYVLAGLPEYGRGLSSEEPDAAGSRKGSVEAGERMGRATGLRAAVIYPPVGRP